jgi:hypothetical protein
MTVLSATFDTRREAELTIERMVQDYGIDRELVTVGPADDENSAGVAPNGSDLPDARADTDTTEKAELAGAIKVTVKVQDEENAAKVREAFGEFEGEDA